MTTDSTSRNCYLRLLDGSLWEVAAEQMGGTINPQDAGLVTQLVDAQPWVQAVGPLFNENRQRGMVRSSAVLAILPQPW